MQFQADILGIPIELTSIPDTTALGAGFLAGLAVGLWQSTDEIAKRRYTSRTFEPKMPVAQREKLYQDWKRAVERSRNWITN
jgi:glycerol kinase